ncbi:glycosyltransferase involved in cell wall biosynthesis [Runella defluvii]|uniref:Glycosyltransferase involved in cell wall biosynthesis n=1 Tax=Runella defluvii TaxID=370973 RepID=A0A7W5ZSK3_9BACT|nr:glycosyltransferase family 4 protein [Runella defluvii]MBB3841331.1 glycosyltransferase involved in cell wall biosynthesis [Runella defluvii]
MKIVFCTNAFENVTNGPVRFANSILEINERFPEHELRILTEDVSDERLASLRYVHKVPVQIPRLLKPLGQILRWFIYYRHVKALEKSFDFDVLVYINSFNGTWASLVSDKPTVGMINDEKNMLAHWGNFAWKSLWFKRFMFQQFERLSAKKHKLVIANSEFLQERIRQTYQLPAPKVTKLYKTIPLDGIEFNPQRAFGSTIKVLFVKADYLVGQLPLVAAALKKLPQYSFLLTVIGPEPWFASHVRSFFETISNVQLDYQGPQPQARVYEALRSHDIFCVPSYTEAFGVANIEALAHGISVVSSRVGGIPEVVDNGNNGWLIESGNVESLTTALVECIENPQLRLKKAENGRKFIQKFSKDEMLRNFVQMLESVVNVH